MDNMSWDFEFIYNGPLENRMACHAGDLGSRAFCNLISDQPMFYIDDSADADDNDAADIELLETIRNRIDAYDKTAKSLSREQTLTTQNQFDNAFNGGYQEPLDIDTLITECEKSDSLQKYIQLMDEYSIQFVADNTIQDVCYNRQIQTISYNPYLSVEKAVLGLSGAMRQAYLHKNGALINPLRFQPEDAVLVNRLHAADKKTFEIEIAWELRLSGNYEVWNLLMNGADHDLCTAYGVEAMSNFRSLKNGFAARMAFEKWFISGRCKLMDRTIIQIMLGNKIDLIFNDADTSRLVATDLVAHMGNRPSGKNYLSSIVTTIMVDSMYTDVRDRSNANFLWFITFEKKMNEVEQELEEDGKIHRTGQSGQSSDGKSAHITEFPSRGNNRQTANSVSSAENGEGALFYLDHFRAL